MYAPSRIWLACGSRFSASLLDRTIEARTADGGGEIFDVAYKNFVERWIV